MKLLNEKSSKVDKTIADFGEQWTNYAQNEGIYAKKETLQDLFGPLIALSDLKKAKVADIGSGTGRIVNMLFEAGCAHVTALEPSEAFHVLVANTTQHKDQISYIQKVGEALPQGSYDYVFSIGVIHHIPDPAPTLRAAFHELREGGKCFIWVYGEEGNETYLRFTRPMRAITTRLPHALLKVITYALYLPLSLYIMLCKYFPLPMHSYMRNVLAKWTPKTKLLTIYDQLNPAVARYYKREEVLRLMEDAGFSQIQLYHRHGYSWSAVGTKLEGKR